MLLVADASHNGRWNIRFHRTFGLVEANRWESLLASLPYSLSDVPDSDFWALSPSKCFTVGSAYRALFRGPVLSWTFHLWKAPMPLKIKIFT